MPPPDPTSTSRMRPPTVFALQATWGPMPLQPRFHFNRIDISVCKCKGGTVFFSLAMAHIHRRVLSRCPVTAQATYTRAPITTPSN